MQGANNAVAMFGHMNNAMDKMGAFKPEALLSTLSTILFVGIVAFMSLIGSPTFFITMVTVATICMATLSVVSWVGVYTVHHMN